MIIICNGWCAKWVTEDWYAGQNITSIIQDNTYRYISKKSGFKCIMRGSWNGGKKSQYVVPLWKHFKAGIWVEDGWQFYCEKQLRLKCKYNLSTSIAMKRACKSLNDYHEHWMPLNTMKTTKRLSNDQLTNMWLQMNKGLNFLNRDDPVSDEMVNLLPSLLRLRISWNERDIRHHMV